MKKKKLKINYKRCNNCSSDLKTKPKIKFSNKSILIQFLGCFLVLFLCAGIYDFCNLILKIKISIPEGYVFEYWLLTTIPGIIIFLIGYSLPRIKKTHCYNCNTYNLEKFIPNDKFTNNLNYILNFYKKIWLK